MKHAREDYNRIQDPWGKIPDDEPVFLLRGQDSLAWHIVKIYAWCAELAGVDPEIVAMCRDQSDKMKAWSKKLPDLPVREGTVFFKTADWWLCNGETYMPGWFFYDEAYCVHGPFGGRDEALAARTTYCETQLGERK